VPRWTVLDLFAGAGGLSLGLQAAGFTVVAAVESDADACSTYRAQHPGAKLYEQDVATVDYRPWRAEVAVVAGGPPCQPFSVGGKRLAGGDERNGVPQFVRAVADLRPVAFLMENVGGLASGARAQYWGAVLGDMEELGYHLCWQVLEAAEHGLPQKRRRLFLVGSRRPGFRFPAPLLGPRAGRPWAASGTVVGLEPLGPPNQAIVTYARQPSLRPQPYHGHLWNGGGRPIDLAQPAPTMLASMGGNKTPWVDTEGLVPAYHAHLVAGGAPRTGVVPGARRITVDEAALLQGFPAGSTFAGRRSSAYRQVGNAVPPPLAERLGQALLRHLGRR
jgi:DNA (cytosine-5)-methyltransferase 1